MTEGKEIDIVPVSADEIRAKCFKRYYALTTYRCDDVKITNITPHSLDFLGHKWSLRDNMDYVRLIPFNDFKNSRVGLDIVLAQPRVNNRFEMTLRGDDIIKTFCLAEHIPSERFGNSVFRAKCRALAWQQYAEEKHKIKISHLPIESPHHRLLVHFAGHFWSYPKYYGDSEINGLRKPTQEENMKYADVDEPFIILECNPTAIVFRLKDMIETLTPVYLKSLTQ